MKTLHIAVVNKVATYSRRDGAIVCGNKDYQIKFTFDNEWDGITTKTARFVWGGAYYDQEFTGTTCPVPMIKGAKEVLVGVYAGDLETTTPALIPCLRSILCATDAPHPESGQNYSSEAVQAAEEAKASAKVAVAVAESIPEDYTTLAHRVEWNTRRINNIEHGIAPLPFVTDDAVVYQREVPANALPYATLDRLGGMSYRVGDEVLHAASTAVVSESADGAKLSRVSIPEAVQALDGYGWGIDGEHNNHFRYEDDGSVTWSKCIVRLVLDGTENWYDFVEMGNASDKNYFRLKLGDTDLGIPYICISNKYQTTQIGSSNNNIGISTMASSSGITKYSGFNLAIRPEGFNNLRTNGFKALLAEWYAAGDPLVVYYTLTAPETTDITDLFTFDNLIRVEAGGTITFVNEGEMAVPSSITYQVKE